MVKLMKYFSIILFLLLIFLFLIFGFNIIGATIAVNSFNELTDFTLIRATKAFYNFINPYSLDNLEKEIPFLYLYTPIMPLISAIVSRVIHGNILLNCYIVNIIFVILTIINMIIILKEKIKKDKFVYIEFIILITFTFFSMFGLPIFNLRPDTIAIYVFTLIVLVLKNNYKNTNLLVFLSILQVFTKQIMFIQTLSIIIFLLLIDKKVVKQFIIKMLIFGVLTIFVICCFFPLYWAESCYTMLYVDNLLGGFDNSIYNILYFYFRYIGILFFIVIGLINLFKNNIKLFDKSNVYKFILENKLIVFVIINIFISTISLLYFAKPGIDGYKYCQDLLAPSILILFIYLSENIFQNVVLKRYFNIILLIITIISLAQFDYSIYTKDNINEYYTLAKDMKKFDGEKIFFEKISVQDFDVKSKYYENKNIYFDDGHIPYFSFDIYDSSPHRIVPYLNEVHRAGVDYRNMVNEMVENQEFKMIVTCFNLILDENILEEKYEIYRTYKIKTDVDIHNVVSWVPKK